MKICVVAHWHHHSKYGIGDVKLNDFENEMNCVPCGDTLYRILDVITDDNNEILTQISDWHELLYNGIKGVHMIYAMKWHPKLNRSWIYRQIICNSTVCLDKTLNPAYQPFVGVNHAVPVTGGFHAMISSWIRSSNRSHEYPKSLIFIYANQNLSITKHVNTVELRLWWYPYGNLNDVVMYPWLKLLYSWFGLH